ncbi:hypothetical protein [Ralstonia pseudosolanacearum]|uniref:hypothetical protein n=1 Tax=Ralstonia pseudosolanacearum TaxID=1310165 RepID=UPI001FFBD6A5|nr:hypothetical protein [Ralstonia pseudosolanacearum]
MSPQSQQPDGTRMPESINSALPTEPMTDTSSPTISRDFAGTRIEGARYAVRLHPVSEWQTDGDPSVAVSVHALPVDGADHGIDLTYDTEQAFALTDIELVAAGAGTELRCLRATAAKSGALAFRTGFVLVLEPGMADAIDTGLRHTDRVTRAGAHVRAALAPHLGRRLWPHEDAAVLEVTANLAQHRRVDEALHGARNVQYEPMFRAGSSDSYAELGAALREPEVLAVLEQVIGFLQPPLVAEVAADAVAPASERGAELPMKLNGRYGPFTPKPGQAPFYRQRQQRQAAARRAAWLDPHRTCANGCGQSVAFTDSIHYALRYSGCCSAACEAALEHRPCQEP